LENNVKVYAIVKNKNSNISTIPSSNNLEILYCELSNINDLKDTIQDVDIDAFYHLAWSGSSGQGRSDYSLQLTNIKYSCDCAILAKEMGCKKFLCAGTITEEIVKDILDVDAKSENMIYGLAKHTTHCMLDILCENIKLDYIWMRFSNIYGPYNNSGNIVSYTLEELKKGNTPAFSKGEQYYDLMYIKDLVNAMYLLGDKNTSYNCYFLGSGNPTLLKNYLLKIKEEYSSNCNIRLGLRREDGIEYKKEWFDIEKLQEDTGYKSLFTFEEGIKETIQWIKEI
ncbi:MAG: NAD-dependent epimerase/dehydratase family protein, partial [Romboutsia sp.]|uniref:NAD-dependent epimerase/dehydratase family protein n=1 Tax=Romboutsia sp. TaxID=1965302 RepID=UPI003F2C52E2